MNIEISHDSQSMKSFIHDLNMYFIFGPHCLMDLLSLSQIVSTANNQTVRFDEYAVLISMLWIMYLT